MNLEFSWQSNPKVVETFHKKKTLKYQPHSGTGAKVRDNLSQ